MPFTPFHWGPAFLLQSLFFFLDPLSLFIGSVIPDIEGIVSIFLFSRQLPLHGPLHSYTMATILAVIVGLFSWFFHCSITFPLSEKYQIPIPRWTLAQSLLSAFIGTYSHIFLDMFLYPEMDLLYPLNFGNPFTGLFPGSWIYLICVLCFIFGAIAFIIRIMFFSKPNVNG